MNTPKLTNEQIIDLLAAGQRLPEIGKVHGMKYKTLERRMEKLKEKHNCKTITQLVLKLKISGEHTIEEQPNNG